MGVPGGRATGAASALDTAGAADRTSGSRAASGDGVVTGRAADISAYAAAKVAVSPGGAVAETGGAAPTARPGTETASVSVVSLARLDPPEAGATRRAAVDPLRATWSR